MIIIIVIIKNKLSKNYFEKKEINIYYVYIIYFKIIVITFKSTISNMKLNDFMFFNVKAKDSYNVELHGQTQSYCWDDSCIFPQSKGFNYALYIQE